MSQIASLLTALRESGVQTKIVAGVVAVLFAAIVGVAGFVAQQAHFEVLAGDLDAAEMTRVTRALADADVSFEHSQPPAPFTVYVEEGARHKAFAAIASAGALDTTPKGIPGAAEGAASVFMSAEERSQMVLKRAWEDAEAQLETLAPITRATVRTSKEATSAFSPSAPVHASVTLVLAPGASLDKQQARNVANIVKFSLNVAPENLVVTDQTGQTIFTGDDGDRGNVGPGTWLEHRTTFDSDLEDQINSFLTANFGPDRARVKINSDWDFDQSVTRSESRPNSQAKLSESKRTTKTPSGDVLLGGPTGTIANLSDPRTRGNVVGSGTVGSPSGVIQPPVAETEDKRTTYAPTTVLTETVRTVPILKHLSISLVFDESLVDRKDELEQSVQAAAGFRSDRGDFFSSMQTVFPKPEELTEEEIAAQAVASEPPAEPSALLETVLERGVEILSAAVFIFLLLKSLKSKSLASTEVAPVATQPEEPPVDPEALARAQLEELLENDPARVGQILSEWVREETESLARSA